jgi:hypothetical protein
MLLMSNMCLYVPYMCLTCAFSALLARPVSSRDSQSLKFGSLYYTNTFAANHLALITRVCPTSAYYLRIWLPDYSIGPGIAV